MNIDGALLKKPIVYIFAILMIGGSINFSLWLRVDVANKKYLKANNEYHDAYMRYQRLISDLTLFEEYKNKYFNYKRQGVIGLCLLYTSPSPRDRG